MTVEYDLVVLGGGTGGYVAAIRASQLGMKVAIVENEKLGGTCLHKGCIPTKALLRSAEVYRQTKDAEKYGVNCHGITLNYYGINNRKNDIIQTLHNGIGQLMKKNHIDIYQGYGRILGPSIFSPVAGTISIEHSDGRENTMLVPKNVLIATGSQPKNIPEVTRDGTYIIDSDDAIELETLPSSIIIVGAGVIGIEWTSMLTDFGVQVTVVEMGERVLMGQDKEISITIEKELSKRGVTFIKEANLLPSSIKITDGVTIDIDVAGNKETLHADKLLVSIGRVANTQNIGLDNTDISLNNGFIDVNQYYQTKESHIYAVGDVIGGLQLAHVAASEGIVAVEHMANESTTPIDPYHVPICVYSFPEIARIGLTEEEAKEQGFDVKVGKFPFKGIGKALVYGETTGFVKVIADEDTNDVLGIHMIGPQVTELISEASLAKLLDATPWELSQSIRPHPALSEVIGEAALATFGKQING